MNDKEHEKIITEYSEQDDLDLIIDDNGEVKDENMNQETKDFSGNVSSFRVTISEAKPFGDPSYASEHI